MFNGSSKRLDKALADIQAIANDAESPAHAFQPHIQTIWKTAHAVKDGSNRALRALTPLLDLPHIGHAACIALCCGGLVEQGADPTIALSALVRRLKAILPECEAFATACFNRGKHEGNTSTDMYELIEEYGPHVAEDVPALARAWAALDLLGRAGVALLSRSREGRQTTRNDQDMYRLIQRLSVAHTWAGWLNDLLRVLDDEVLLVVHPALERGYRVRISGITDNFQLHLLLADLLIGKQAQGWLPGSRPPANSVAIARGLASGTKNTTAQGVFNMVGWRGLRSDGRLTDGVGDSAHWIWGEGIPADIEPFDGVRVVLLTDSPYKRYWNVEQRFSGLVADIQVLEQLDTGSARAWIQRMVAQLAS